MCNFCNKPKLSDEEGTWINKPELKNDSLTENLSTIIKGNSLHFEYDAYSTDSSFGEIIVIKFCPMCGRKL